MANSNNQLQTAKKAREDEFYTQLCDIENELRHYRTHFKGKTVLCNCDDPRVSNFFKYFALNFEILGLKKLIATCYKNNEPDLFSMNTCEQAVYIIYEGDKYCSFRNTNQSGQFYSGDMRILTHCLNYFH